MGEAVGAEFACAQAVDIPKGGVTNKPGDITARVTIIMVLMAKSSFTVIEQNGMLGVQEFLFRSPSSTERLDKEFYENRACSDFFVKLIF